MKIFAIGDLHLAHSVPDKSMDIFGENWVGHFEKIQQDWRERVSDDDVVLIPGDISWAMHLTDAMADLDAISDLPGRKILLKGNHDFWWQSISKINAAAGEDMMFLQNNSFDLGDVIICGTRGWNVPGSNEFSADDQKIFTREVERLKLSLDSRKTQKDTIVMMHYPPYNDKVERNDMITVLLDYGITRVIFGHIHGVGLRYLKEGEFFGIQFSCVSCDHLDFRLKQL